MGTMRGRRPFLKQALAGLALLAHCAAAGAGTRGRPEGALVLPGLDQRRGLEPAGLRGLKKDRSQGGFKTIPQRKRQAIDIRRWCAATPTTATTLSSVRLPFGQPVHGDRRRVPENKFSAHLRAEGTVPPNVMFVNTRPYDVAYGMGALAARSPRRAASGWSARRHRRSRT